MSYRVSFKASAQKSLDKLPKAVQARIVEKAIALGADPRPTGCVKLAGDGELWRIRIGNYPMAYMIDDVRETVDIRIVAHRREVYREL